MQSERNNEPVAPGVPTIHLDGMGAVGEYAVISPAATRLRIDEQINGGEMVRAMDISTNETDGGRTVDGIAGSA